jgi:hypothetical protein
MRKLLYIFCFAALTPFLTGCFEEPGTATLLEEQFVSFYVPASQINETGGGGTVQIDLAQGASSNVTVELSIESNGLVEGVDFELPGGTSYTIPSGEFSIGVPYTVIDNDVFSPNTQSFTVTISSVSSGIAIMANGSTTVTIIEDDCEIPSLAGEFSVVNRDASPAACGDPENDETLTYTSTITLVEQLGPNSFIYELSDVTGGLYALCYGDGPNPGQITVENDVITMTNVPDDVYGGDVFNGSGLIDCDGNFELVWSNGFGDQATSIYTR